MGTACSTVLFLIPSQASMSIVLAAALLVASPSSAAVPEETGGAPVERIAPSQNPENSWRGKITRLTAYPAGEGLRFELVLSPALNEDLGRRLSQVTVYADLLPQLRVGDWVLVRGKKFCIRPEASGKFESGHLSLVWEVTLDDRSPAKLFDAAWVAPPFARPPGRPECTL